MSATPSRVCGARGSAEDESRPLRVFHLIKSLGRGGAETLLVQGAAAAPEGVEQAFGYFLPWKDTLVPALREQGVHVECFPANGALGMLRRAPAVARALHAWQADLVHCHLPLAGMVGRLAGRLADVPVVYTEHNLQERYRWPTRLANQWTWRWQAAVVAVSDDVRASAVRSAGDRVPIVVVRNGIPVARTIRDEAAGRAVKQRLEIPASAPVVGTVAVLRLQKRLDLWLEAAQSIRTARGDAHFVIVGDGPERTQLECKAQSLGLEAAVRWTCLQDDVRPYLSAMDVYLSSSDFEGLPLALLEAMAMELPVVATSVGGVPEAVEDGVTGHLAPRGDVSRLSQQVLEVLAKPEAARDLGRRGRERVVERFSTVRMQRDLLDVYHQVLQGRRARSGGQEQQ